MSNIVHRVTHSITGCQGEVKMSSMMGDVFDRFLRSTEARQYLHDRHSIGAGEHTLTPSSLILCTSDTMSRVVCRLHPSHIPHPHSHTLLHHLCTLHAICTTSLSFQPCPSPPLNFHPNLCTHLLSRPIPSPFPSYRLHTEDIWGASHSPDGSPEGGLPWR